MDNDTIVVPIQLGACVPKRDGLINHRDMCNGTVIERVLADSSVASAKIDVSIESDNYSAGSAGWKIERVTGDAEFNNVVVRGDIVSGNWNGSTDISTGASTAGSSGFFLDTDAGSAQFSNDLFVGGTLELSTGGKITTAPSSNRVELANTDVDRINFYTGDASETAAGYIRAFHDSGLGDNGLLIQTNDAGATLTMYGAYVFLSSGRFRMSKIGSAALPEYGLANNAGVGMFTVSTSTETIGFAAGSQLVMSMSTARVWVDASVDRFGIPTKGTSGDPSSPQDGDMYCNTNDNKIRVYADAAWRDLATW